jgi:hypothetical protein
MGTNDIAVGAPSEGQDGNDIAVEPSKEKRWQRHLCARRGAHLFSFCKKPPTLISQNLIFDAKN